jgi:hypothetical protein
MNGSVLLVSNPLIYKLTGNDEHDGFVCVCVVVLLASHLLGSTLPLESLCQSYFVFCFCFCFFGGAGV